MMASPSSTPRDGTVVRLTITPPPTDRPRASLLLRRRQGLVRPAALPDARPAAGRPATALLGGPRRTSRPVHAPRNAMVELEVTDWQPVVLHRQAGQRVDVDRVGDRPDTAVAEDELADAGMVAAEPLFRPVVVLGRRGQRSVDGPRGLTPGHPHDGSDVVAV